MNGSYDCMRNSQTRAFVCVRRRVGGGFSGEPCGGGPTAPYRRTLSCVASVALVAAALPACLKYGPGGGRSRAARPPRGSRHRLRCAPGPLRRRPCRSDPHDMGEGRAAHHRHAPAAGRRSTIVGHSEHGAPPDGAGLRRGPRAQR
eukprot:2382731-Prymnesium_polylepis.1